MYVKLVLMTFKKSWKESEEQDRNLITGTKDPHLNQLKFFFVSFSHALFFKGSHSISL